MGMDKVGDALLGYSLSDGSIDPSIAITGRVPTDTLGMMETETRIVTGAHPQTTTSRWGDYSATIVDPLNDLTSITVGLTMIGSDAKGLIIAHGEFDKANFEDKADEVAKEMGNGPVNKKVDVAMAELRMAPVGERAKLIYSPDWDAINAQREEWTKRWNREVER